MEIKFYEAHNDYGFLSNFYLSDITLDNKKWKSVEHYYQAQKFIDPIKKEKIKQCKTPGRAKKYAHKSNSFVRPDWDEIKVDVMKKGVYAKFMQSVYLKSKLLLTEDALLIEDSPVDLFWGIGIDGTGKNMLGKILMDLRINLKENHKNSYIQNI